MGEPKLGQLVGETRSRDAVHVAIIPVVSDQELAPGQHIAFDKGIDKVKSVPACDGVGIVDPFLTGKVERGQRFYMCMYPGTTTSLRHVWTHPAITQAINALKDKGEL